MPLADGDALLAALRAWEACLPEGLAADMPEHVERARARAAAAAAARRAHEAAVAPERPADTDLLAAYMAYIKLEEVRAIYLGRIRCLQLIGQMGLHGTAAGAVRRELERLWRSGALPTLTCTRPALSRRSWDSLGNAVPASASRALVLGVG